MDTIRRIGSTIIQPRHRASCHCGGVVLELDLADGVVDARRCNCSMCRRKGAIMGAVPLAGLRVVQGRELLSVYRFNLGCLEGVDPYLVEDVPVNDGVNHPADRPPCE